MDKDPRGLAVAREYARWELGDKSWADTLIDIYLDPDKGIEIINRSRSKFPDMDMLTSDDFESVN